MTKVFETRSARLELEDVFLGIKSFPDRHFDLAIIDPPYGASTRANWSLPANHSLNGFGGEWKLANHDWDKITGHGAWKFTIAFLEEMKRVVKPTGSFWVHATYHNAGFVNVACQLLGLEIINEIIWFKRNAFPNLSGRRLTASHETIYWVHTGNGKREYRFNYEETKQANFEEDSIKVPGKQLRTVWDIPNNKKREEFKLGSHPTQKPLRISERLLLISGLKGGKLLVPFLGSGTEAVAGIKYGMKVNGFEIDPQFFEIACSRVQEIEKILTTQPSFL